jgi:MFS family permease
MSFPDPFLSNILIFLFYSVAWGAILACHAACHNYAGFMVVRFLLGMMEASVAPGFSFLTGKFYKRGEQPLR